MKREDEKDSKTWTFELSLKKQMIKKIGIFILIVLLGLLILSSVSVLCITKSLGSVKEAIRIVFRVLSVILLSILFVGWIISKKIRKK